jgi:acetoacetyl-CoA synthetase
MVITFAVLSDQLKLMMLYALTGYLPNSLEAVEAMLAAASLGAIWSSTSPDFGVYVSH